MEVKDDSIEASPFTERELAEIYDDLQFLNELKSPHLEDIFQSIKFAVSNMRKYKCKYCLFTCMDKESRDNHILQEHEEVINCFKLNVAMLIMSSTSLYPYIPDLEGYIKKIKDSSGKILIATNSIVDVKVFYFDCRLALEHITSGLLRHFGVLHMDKSVRLEEMLVKLKSLTKQPSKLNSFFNMKNISGSCIHEIVNLSDTGDLKSSDQMIMYFRNVIDEAVDMFQNPPSAPVILDPLPITKITEKVNEAGDLYKTRLCQHYVSNGKCPLGNRCKFAHGVQELRRAKCAFFIRGVCKLSNCQFLHSLE
jgi:hypothetical protein